MFSLSGMCRPLLLCGFPWGISYSWFTKFPEGCGQQKSFGTNDHQQIFYTRKLENNQVCDVIVIHWHFSLTFMRLSQKSSLVVQSHSNWAMAEDLQTTSLSFSLMRGKGHTSTLCHYLDDEVMQRKDPSLIGYSIGKQTGGRDIPTVSGASWRGRIASEEIPTQACEQLPSIYEVFLKYIQKKRTEWRF